MPETRLKCPSCDAVLKLGAPLAPGKAVKCPKCGAAVRGSAPGKTGGVTRDPERPRPAKKIQPDEEPEDEVEDEEQEEEAAPRTKKRPRGKADSEETPPERPRKRRKKEKARQKSPALLWGMVGGGVGLAVILVVVLVATGAFRKKEKASGDGKQANAGKDLSELIVGKWTRVSSNIAGKKGGETIEFHKDGTFIKVFPPFDPETHKYRVVGPGEIEVLYPGAEGRTRAERWKVSLKGNDLTITAPPALVTEYTRAK